MQRRWGRPQATEEGYRGPQVCAVVGITYRQLDYWARTDLLRPSITEARGSGTQRRYSYADLLQLKVIKRLLDAGISLQIGPPGHRLPALQRRRRGHGQPGHRRGPYRARPLR